MTRKPQKPSKTKIKAARSDHRSTRSRAAGACILYVALRDQPLLIRVLFIYVRFSFNHHMYGTRGRAWACMGHGMRLSVLKAKNAWPPRVVTRGPASIFECTQGVLNLIQI